FTPLAQPVDQLLTWRLVTGEQFGRRRNRRWRRAVEIDEQRCDLALIAVAPLGPADVEVLRRSGDGDIQQSRLLRARTEGPRRAMWHQPGFAADKVYRLPFAPFGSVEREDFDPVGFIVEWVTRAHPGAEPDAVAGGLLAQKIKGRGGN